MKTRGFAVAVAAGLAGAAMVLAAPAAAAPEGPGSAEQAISDLESQGYVVVVDRLGSTPLDRATVRSVRPGQDYQRLTGGTVYLEVG